MRFNLTLAVVEEGTLPANYPYLLSSAIYQFIHKAGNRFSAFLRDFKHVDGNNHFKLFTFSDLQAPFRSMGDRVQLLADKATLTVCLYVPVFAEDFIKGLFLDQRLEIGDEQSRVIFLVEAVECIAFLLPSHSSESLIKTTFHPMSPIVVGRKRGGGRYDYRSPRDYDFMECLLSHWLEKYQSVYWEDAAMIQRLREQIRISLSFFAPVQERLVAARPGTGITNPIRGFTNFRLAVTAPAVMVELVLDAGLGLYNCQGFGCVDLVRTIDLNATSYAEVLHSTNRINIRTHASD